jgi:Ca2+-binding RTX toxin-like protein
VLLLLPLAGIFLFSGDEEDDASTPLNVTENEAFNGSDASETITGTALGDTIFAAGGDDTVEGAGGEDYVYGGEGNDTVNGGDAHDHIYGDAGDDTLNGGNDRDSIAGGSGNDTIHGGDDDSSDLLFGNGGDDLLYGGAGDDQIEGGYGDDRIFLGDGDDESGGTGLIDGDTESNHQQTGDDFIRGGSGDEGADIIYARDTETETTPDVIYGGYGADRFLVDNADTVTGGAGADATYVVRDNEDEYVTFTDFDPAEDTLEIEWTGENRDDHLIDIEPVSGGVMVTYDGIDMVLLEGLSMADIPENMDIDLILRT